MALATALQVRRFVQAFAACKIAREPSRALDALIATATFPALPEHRCGTNGVWIQEDGPRVRALRYSDSYKAAATLTLPGHWIEAHDTGYMIALTANGAAHTKATPWRFALPHCARALPN